MEKLKVKKGLGKKGSQIPVLFEEKKIQAFNTLKQKLL